MTQPTLKEAALAYHQYPTPGKLGVSITKPTETQRDLALAYTPGVAEPVKAIAEDPEAAYLYTNKGNLVGVISNGTAILGLGNRGALASSLSSAAVTASSFSGRITHDTIFILRFPPLSGWLGGGMEPSTQPVSTPNSRCFYRISPPR